MEGTRLVIVPPGNSLGLQLIEDRESVELGKFNEVRLQSGVCPRKREESIRIRGAKHRLEIVVGKSELPSQFPVVRKLPFVIIPHRLERLTWAPPSCDHRKAVIRSVVPCFEHLGPTVGQIIRRTGGDPMRRNTCSTSVR